MKLCDTCIYGSKTEYFKPCIIYRDDCEYYEEKRGDMTKEEAKSCIGTIELLRRLAYNIHGVMDVIDADNCEKIIKALEQEPCGDAISREAVQDYIAKYLSQYLYEDVRQAVEVIDEFIGELPSVNPQELRWIPVSERLPESDEEVLVCGYDTYNKKVIISRYQGKQYGFTCGLVSAWMPLPLPYKAN